MTSKLTHNHLSIYRRYLGNIDAFARSGTPKEKACLTEAVWICLRDLLQRLSLEDSSDETPDEEFIRETTRQLQEAADDKSIVAAIRELARQEEHWLNDQQTKPWWQFWR